MTDDDGFPRPAGSGRLSPEVLGELSAGDYIRVHTDETRGEPPTADHGIGDGNLYCVTEVVYRSDEIPDVIVKPVPSVGEWPDVDTAMYVILETQHGVALATRKGDEIEPVQPVDELREMGWP